MMASSRSQLKKTALPIESPAPILASDYCPTPEGATLALFGGLVRAEPPEEFPGTIWEPASGTGAMARVLEKQCPNSTVIATEKEKRTVSWKTTVRKRSPVTLRLEPTEVTQTAPVYGQGGVDFLTCPPRECSHIVTNPPYSIMEEFVLRAKQIAKHKIAMLLPLYLLETEYRRELLEDQRFPLRRIKIFSSRVQWSVTGHAPGACAWFIWENPASMSHKELVNATLLPTRIDYCQVRHTPLHRRLGKRK